jgi:hypothetical protein
MARRPFDVCVKSPDTLKTPTGGPGLTSALLMTLPVIEPYPLRRPPRKSIGTAEITRPPRRTVWPFVCVKAPANWIAPVLTWRLPLLVADHWTTLRPDPTPLTLSPAALLIHVPSLKKEANEPKKHPSPWISNTPPGEIRMEAPPSPYR